jgi:hypothetical protein
MEEYDGEKRNEQVCGVYYLDRFGEVVAVWIPCKFTLILFVRNVKKNRTAGGLSIGWLPPSGFVENYFLSGNWIYGSTSNPGWQRRQKLVSR